MIIEEWEQLVKTAASKAVEKKLKVRNRAVGGAVRKKSRL